MSHEDAIKWLENLKQDIGQLRHEDLWPYAQAIDEIIATMEEQEPVPSGKRIKAGDVALNFFECGYCKNAIRKPWRYCPFCGKAVKRE
jgi:hypothetical protein